MKRKERKENGTGKLYEKKRKEGRKELEGKEKGKQIKVRKIKKWKEKS